LEKREGMKKSKRGQKQNGEKERFLRKCKSFFWGGGGIIEMEFQGQKEKYRIAIMIILVVTLCFLTYYFHASLGVSIIFTHSFYLPIILASLWWKKKGLIVAIFLAVFLIWSHIFVRQDVASINDYLRASLFIVTGFVAAILRQEIAQVEERVKFAYAELN